MSKPVCVLLCLVLLCCDDNDQESGSSTIQIASWMCGKSKIEMQWLTVLVHQAKTDVAMHGDIYGGSVDGRVIFVHQPLIMSCLACIVYDCDGNRVDVATIDHEKLRLILEPQNKIYSAY